MSHDRIQDFWQALLPREKADQPCLYTLRKDSFQPSSFKDLNAQAHCAAAFLMDRGLEKGSVLAVISKPSLPVLAIDLALQFLGAVGLYISPERSLEEIQQCITQNGARFVFVGDHETYLQHGELASLKPDLKGIFLNTEDAEGLAAEKLITYDIMVLRGKSVWREETQRLNEQKANVGPSDTYALFPSHPENPTQVKPVTYASVLQHLAKAEERISQLKTGNVISLASADRYLQHIHGAFAPLAIHRPLYLLDAAQLNSEKCATAQPAVIVGQPQDLQAVYDMLPTAFFGKPDTKPFEKAQELIDIREEAEAAGKKAPFMKNLKYKSHNKGLYKQVKKRFGGHLGLMVCDHEEPTHHTARFFRECGLPVELTKLV